MDSDVSLGVCKHGVLYLRGCDKCEGISEMQYRHKMKMHRPKGSMCIQCIRKSDNCSALDFKHMPVIGKDRDGTVIVRCTEYDKDPFLAYLVSLPKADA